MCKFQTKNNRRCKNGLYRKNMCYIHYTKLNKNTTKKRVSFNLEKNEIQETPIWISSQKKLEDGRWHYTSGKNPRCFKNIKYDYTHYGKYFIIVDKNGQISKKN